MGSGTENILFIPKHQVPAGRKSIYDNAVCDYRPLKDDPYFVLLTVGGDRIIYHGYPRSPSESLLDSKLISNITISTPGARFFVQISKIIF